MNWYNPFKKISKLEIDNQQLKLEVQMLERKLQFESETIVQNALIIKHWRIVSILLGAYSIGITLILVLTINYL